MSSKIKKLVWNGPWAETPWGCYKIKKAISEPINGPGSPRSPEEVSYVPLFNGQRFNGYIYGDAEMAKDACQKNIEENINLMLDAGGRL
jgi:hypothetical protein